MKKLTKEEALTKIEELKEYVAKCDGKEEKEEKKGIKIYNKDGEVIYESEKETLKEAVEEAVDGGANLREANLWGADLGGADLGGANLREADLREANLWGADLWGAELCNAKFYGKGGTSKLKKDQVKDFLNALGFQIED